MSFAAHGNWCGPGWSAGKWKDAKDLTEEDKQVEAIDALDQACKNHDIAIAEGDPEANEKFEQEAGALGFKGAAFATLVKWLGPSSQSILQNKMKNKEKRKEAYENARQRAESNRARLKKEQEERRSIQRQFHHDENRVYAVNGNGESSERKRKAEEDLDDTSDRYGKQDEFPVANPDDMIHATIDEEMNQNLITPNRPTPQMVPTLTREDRPIRGQPERSLTNLLHQVDMDNQDVEMAPMALRVGSTSSDGDVSNNTNVMPKYNIPREIGFWTERRSAMLPVSIYFSVNKLDASSPVVLKFMLNDTYDIFRFTSVQKQTFPAISTSYFPDSAESTNTNGNYTTQYTKANYAGVNRSKGISNDMAYSIFNLTANGIKTYKPIGLNMLRAIQFPTTTRTSVAGQGSGGGDPQTTGNGLFGYGTRANTGDYAMAWRDYYERNYRNRHVMQCDWKLTIESAETGAFHRGVVLNATETITTQTQATPTIPTNKNLSTLLRFKRIKENRLTNFNAQGGRTKDIISGSWSPNKNIRRDVVDDERTKVWYPTKNVNSPSPFDWKEFETLLFYNDEMSNNQNAYFNCKLDLLYHVQYRDLEEYIRYPEYAEVMTPVLYREDATYPAGTFPAGTSWPSGDEPSTLTEGRMFSTWATPAVNA